MLRKTRQIDKIATLYRDDETGIAVVYDAISGYAHSAHPNVCASGSVSGIRKLHLWSQKDRVVRAGEYNYNIDRIAIDTENVYDCVAASECMCDACQARRRQTSS